MALRVLHLIDSLGLGGAQVVVEHLVGFAPPDATHRVMALHGDGPVAERLRAAGFQAGCLVGKRTDPMLPVALLREVWRFRPHVVHAHLVVSSLLAETLRPLFPRGTAVACSLQNMALQHRDHPYQNRLERLLYRRCDVAIACSRIVASSARPLRPRRLATVPNAIADDRITGPDAARRAAARASLGIAPDALVMLSASRLAVQKNLAYALEVFAHVRRRLPEAVYLLAGDGPLKDDLHAHARALGLDADAVRFLGYRGDVADLMHAADLFFLPSHYEGLSLVLVESIGSGLPPVVTPFPGVDEVVRDGLNGVVIPFDQADAAAARVAATLADEAQRARLARRAVAVARRRFRASQMSARYHQIYASIRRR